MKKISWGEKNTITGTMIRYLLPAIILLFTLLPIRLLGEYWELYSRGTGLILFFIIGLVIIITAMTLTIVSVYRAEEALRRSEKLAHLLVEKRKDYAIFMVDPHGKIMNWNTSAEHLLGYTAEEIIGKSFDLFYLPEDQQKNKAQKILELTQIQKQIETESWLKHKNDSRFWVMITSSAIFNENDQLIGFAILLRNVTKQKEAEVKFSLLLEAAPDAMVIVDRQGKIVLANTQTEKMFGYVLNELVDQQIEILLPQHLHQTHVQHRQHYYADPKRRHMGAGLELSGRRKDGSEFPVEISLSPLETAQGLLVTAAVRDITTRKQADIKLQQLITNLERSNKELERFAYIASHDLQEPLRMIASFTQLLSKKYKDKLDQEANEYIEFAVDGALRMQQLITDLLAYSRVATKGKPFAPTDCKKIVEQAIRNLSVAIEESHAKITYDALPVIPADDVQLLQLFQNLLSNAIKFHDHHKPPEIHVSAHQIKNVWNFYVKDNGIGINPEFHEKIFLIFQRLHGKKEYPGTGVGLAICKKIIERHGGKIWVESMFGKGANFCFTIPA